MAKNFSSLGSRTFTEGLVVKFFPSTGASWVGNFIDGECGISTVIDHPNGKSVIAISGGLGYIVDPEHQTLLGSIAGCIWHVTKYQGENLLIFGDNCGFEAIGESGIVWKTRRIAWDEMRNIRLIGSTIYGEARELDDSWTPFEVDAKTGQLLKGSWVSKEGESLNEIS